MSAGPDLYRLCVENRVGEEQPCWAMSNELERAATEGLPEPAGFKPN